MILLLNMLVLLLTFGTVSIIDYDIYNIDNVAYENLTYRDIFGGKNNLFDFDNIYDNDNTYVDNNNLIFYYNNSSVYFSRFYSNDFSFTDNDIIYLSFDYHLLNDYELSQIYIRLYSGEYTSKYISLLEQGNISFINIYSSTTTSGYFSVFYNDLIGDKINNDEFLQISNILLYDLTSIFGTGNEPSQSDFEEMLQYYSQYQEESDFSYTFKDLSYTEFGTIFLFLIFDFVVFYVIRKGLF